jgi:hypothetical protein
MLYQLLSYRKNEKAKIGNPLKKNIKKSPEWDSELRVGLHKRFFFTAIERIYFAVWQPIFGGLFIFTLKRYG